MLENLSIPQYAERKNLLGADNQQGSLSDPSTTTRTTPECIYRKRRKRPNQEGYIKASTGHWIREIRNNTAYCSYCRQWIPTSLFTTCGPKNLMVHCNKCRRYQKAADRYGITMQEAEKLYSVTCCQCCGTPFEKDNRDQHIHHIGNEIHGVLCRICNHTIRNESPEHLHRLVCCVRFIQKWMKI